MDEPTQTPTDSLTAAERLAMVMGRPAPTPLSEPELRAFEAAQDRADEEVLRIYGQHRQAAA